MFWVLKVFFASLQHLDASQKKIAKLLAKMNSRLFFLKFLFFKNRPPKRGYEKDQKVPKILRGMFWVLKFIFCKITTSRYLTEKKLLNFWRK